MQLVMEAIGGGGHLTMAGALLKDTGMDQAKAAACAGDRTPTWRSGSVPWRPSFSRRKKYNGDEGVPL